MGERGTGHLFRPVYTARDGSKKEAAVWWLRLSVNGKKVLLCTETRDYKEALKFQRKKAVELAEGQTAGLTVGKITLEKLEEKILEDYRNNGRTSSRHIIHGFVHLREHLGHLLAHQIDEDTIESYKSKRLLEEAAPATVNLELAVLQRCLGLCRRKLVRVPRFQYLVVKNARKGFFERPEFDAILSAIPERSGRRRDFGAVLEVAYVTGWRVASELLTRQWRHVDFVGGWLRLDPNEAKNSEGRMFPLIDSLRAVLEAQRAWTEELERKRGIIIPWVFHRNGRPISSMQFAWQRAREAAGQSNKLLHDCRRTAVRNLERAGVGRSAAMAMVGHKTEAMYRRYSIVDEALLKEAGEKLAALHEYQRNAVAKVSSIKG